MPLSPIHIFDTEGTETPPNPESRLRAFDCGGTTPDYKPVGLIRRRLPAITPLGLPGSDATRKFALRAKGTERRASLRGRIVRLDFRTRVGPVSHSVLFAQGRISVTRGKPKPRGLSPRGGDGSSRRLANRRRLRGLNRPPGRFGFTRVSVKSVSNLRRTALVSHKTPVAPIARLPRRMRERFRSWTHSTNQNAYG